MKIAISATGQDMECDMDPRFGRAPFFIIIDSETEEWTAEENGAAGASGGAGRSAAALVAGKGASAVVSANFGPNALQSLQAAGVTPYQATIGSIADVYRRWKEGMLSEAG
jgi:predicted Fe-Mo cluster-binding NifX family protein